MTDDVSDQRDKRSGVIIRAAIIINGQEAERRVRNLSRRGACIDNQDDLVEGMVVRVSMGTLGDLRATVMWTRPHLAGLRFDRSIDLEAARQPRRTAATAQSGWMADMNHAYRRRA